MLSTKVGGEVEVSGWGSYRVELVFSNFVWQATLDKNDYSACINTYENLNVEFTCLL